MGSASDSRVYISKIVCLLTLCSLTSLTEGRQTANVFDSGALINRTTETFHDVHDPIATHTTDFVGNISKDVQDLFHAGNSSWTERLTHCSIVLGGAAAGAGIGILALWIAVPLVLCLFGFTCWGIMAGSAAACCQSGIGDVPAGSCFACVQSLGAGGMGLTYFIIACIVGTPGGLYNGGLVAESYFHCFTTP